MSTSQICQDNLNTVELISSIRDGDKDAVNSLFGRVANPIRNLVRSRLDKKIQRRVDVSDVVQEVLCEANRRLETYVRDPKLPFGAWIRQIARDRMIDAHRRHRGSAKRSVDREQAMNNSNSQNGFRTLSSQLPDSRNRPDDLAMQNELALAARKNVAKLGKSDRQIIELRHYDSLTNLEVARHLKITEPAASMRYLRAIRRLRSMMDDDSQ